MLRAVLQSILHHGGRHAVAEQLGLHCKRAAPGAAAGATAEELAQQLLQFMMQHAPDELGLVGKDSSSSSSTTLDSSNVPSALVGSSAGDSSTTTAADRKTSSSSSSSIGRSRLAKVRQGRSAWGRLPTQRQLVAAGRPDLAAGLQKFGHERIRLLLGLPQPTRKQLRKVCRVDLEQR